MINKINKKNRILPLVCRVMFLVFLFFLSLSLSSAQEQKVDIVLEIKTDEIQDACVVGDSFHYKINLTNTGTEIINDTFRISVFNPSRNLIESRKYTIVIEPNNSKLIVAEGGKKNETAVFPFDTRGDYKIEVSATKLIDFYRWVKEGRYVRQTKKLNYFFDVMPRWEYNSWKSSEEANQKSMIANQKSIEANQKLLDLTIDLKNATESMETATWIMVTVAVITLSVAVITLFVTLRSRK